jgi:hypothetical protein
MVVVVAMLLLRGSASGAPVEQLVQPSSQGQGFTTAGSCSTTCRFATVVANTAVIDIAIVIAIAIAVVIVIVVVVIVLVVVAPWQWLAPIDAVGAVGATHLDSHFCEVLYENSASWMLLDL